MKGFNISSYTGVEEAKALCRFYKSIGCNVIRWQMNAQSDSVLFDRILYGRWLLEQTEKMLEVANAVEGLKFIADLHSNYGGVVTYPHAISEHQVFQNDYTENQWQNDVAFVMQLIEPHPVVFAIEAINEPHARASVYAEVMHRARDFFRAHTSKRIYVSSVFGSPRRLKHLPRLGKQFHPTCHFWPTPLSLIGAGGYEARGNEEQVIAEGRFLAEMEAIEAHPRKVLIGELGCTRGIGDDLQRRYIKKALAYCKRKRLDVIIHGEAENPAYGYEETGVLDEVAECFRTKW